MKLQTKHQSPVTTLYLKTMNAVVERKYLLIALLYFILMFSALILVQWSRKDTTALLTIPNSNTRPAVTAIKENTEKANATNNVSMVTLSAGPLTSCRIIICSSSW